MLSHSLPYLVNELACPISAAKSLPGKNASWVKTSLTQVLFVVHPWVTLQHLLSSITVGFELLKMLLWEIYIISHMMPSLLAIFWSVGHSPKGHSEHCNFHE